MIKPLKKLSKAGQAVWDEQLETFRPVLCGPGDIGVFTGYCDVLARIEEVEKEIDKLTKKDKFMVKNGYGAPSEHPIWRTLDRLEKLKLNYLKQLTPTTGRIVAMPPEKPKPPEEVVNRQSRLDRKMGYVDNT